MEDLLTSYFTGDISPQDKARLFEAMAHDEDLRKNFYTLQNALALAQSLPRNEDAEVGGRQYLRFAAQRGKTAWRRFAVRVARYAAIVCLTAASAYFLAEYRQDRKQDRSFTEITAPSGQRVKVSLPDGTVAWIGPCSTLRYHASFNAKDRNVQLEGSVYFDVAHHPRKPFSVSAGNYTVTALGTRFNAVAYPGSDSFQVDLIEGCVRINNLSDSTDEVTLHAHEQAFVRNNRLCKTPSDFDNEEYLRSGIVRFDNRPLGEVLRNIALWQGVELIIADDVDAHRPVTGKIRQSDSLESILRALQSIVSFRYETIDERHIKIVH